VRFNMSHSHDLVLCAISRGTDVGVDVERLRPGVEEDVGRCFSSRTLRFLEALPQPARRRAFFQAWTRMEAYSKARGEGLTLDLEAVERFVGLRKPVLLPSLGDAEREWRWWLRDFAPRKGYVAALAAQRGSCRLRYWKWQGHEPGSSRRSESSLIQPGIGMSNL
jgi:4'-phosphopantetheinyl transferase